MTRLHFNKIIMLNLAVIGFFFAWNGEWAHASAIQSTQVGTANGPEGPTNIQTVANFENHPLYTIDNPASDGHYWQKRFASLDMYVDNCGPTGSTKCLAIRQKPGHVGTTAWDLAPYVYYSGPRKGENAYITEARRANNFTTWVKGFSYPYDFDSRFNLQLPGFHKRRTPSTLSINSAETDNLHYYSDFRLEWYPTGAPAQQAPVWRKLNFSTFVSHQRSEFSVKGYDLFLEFVQQMPDATRFYYHFRFDRYAPEEEKGTAYIDNVSYNYTNPFIAAFPAVSIQHGALGEVTVHQGVVWNTHPTNTRNLIFDYSGKKRSNRICFQAENIVVKNSVGNVVTQTGPLAPGAGFAYSVEQTIPEISNCTQPTGTPPVVSGDRAVGMISIYQDPAEIPNSTPWVETQPVYNFAQGRLDLPGVGVTFKTVIEFSPVVVNPPPAISDMSADVVGGSWIDVSWTSPAASTYYSELSDDTGVMSYQIRYSKSPITDEVTWKTATPIESVAPVFGPGIPQHFTVKGLNTSTKYFVGARTYNENYEGGQIASIMATTKMKDIDSGNGSSSGTGDNIPPSQPVNLTVE